MTTPNQYPQSTELTEFPMVVFLPGVETPIELKDHGRYGVIGALNRFFKESGQPDYPYSSQLPIKIDSHPGEALA